MKAVLISIQPKWCELIVNGKKTVEVRKTKPKLETPFKVYIYQTKAYDTLFGKGQPKKLCIGGGRVIGEFVCNAIDKVMSVCTPCMDYITVNNKMDMFFPDVSCLDIEDLSAYLGVNVYGYGWHINDLVIYDKPKELSEFEFPSDEYFASYKKREKILKGITRPPQSWCYVKELVG